VGNGRVTPKLEAERPPAGRGALPQWRPGFNPRQHISSKSLCVVSGLNRRSCCCENSQTSTSSSRIYGCSAQFGSAARAHYCHCTAPPADSNRGSRGAVALPTARLASRRGAPISSRSSHAPPARAESVSAVPGTSTNGAGIFGAKRRVPEGAS
jgi:hypothetical protein